VRPSLSQHNVRGLYIQPRVHCVVQRCDNADYRIRLGIELMYSVWCVYNNCAKVAAAPELVSGSLRVSSQVHMFRLEEVGHSDELA
jgi:hypothetical protein